MPGPEAAMEVRDQPFQCREHQQEIILEKCFSVRKCFCGQHVSHMRNMARGCNDHDSRWPAA